jgi:RimJ/RimL family protein N-acetyltransferase
VTGPLPAGPAGGSRGSADGMQAAAGGPLATLLDEVAAGKFPPPDGGVTILPQPSPRDAGVIGFTAHSVIFTDEDPAWVRDQLRPDDLSAALLPPFLQAICARTGRRFGSVDVLCLAAPLPGPPPSVLATSEWHRCRWGDIGAAPMSFGEGGGKQRLARALRYRDDVRAWEVPGGIVILGRGVAGRWEVSLEVEPEHRGQGLGRELALAARHLVPGGAPLWAQIAPGNAASVRAFLAAGYRPAGAEALLPLA